MTGVSSRTLRHYHHIGLLEPSRTSASGQRWYDQSALVRLQRILLLRQLGLGLEVIAQVLSAEQSVGDALRHHLDYLHAEQDRLALQADSVHRTLTALEQGEPMTPEKMFEGFDHTHYREEVERRWGTEAYARGDRWWASMSPAEREAWQGDLHRLNEDWIAAATSGAAPDGAAAQDLAHRHVQWLTSVPGTPAAQQDGNVRGYLLGLAQMYVHDERFAANYGGAGGARFVHDALTAYVDQRL